MRLRTPALVGAALVVATGTFMAGTLGAQAAPGGTPTVTITAPAAGATVSGTVNVTGTASSSNKLKRVDVSVDGGTRQLATGTTSWVWAFDTTAYSTGSHTLVVRATSSTGTVGSASVTVSVATSTTTTTTTTTTTASPSPSPSPTATTTTTTTSTASCPSGATAIAAGADIQSALTAGASGQSFCLAPSLYRVPAAITPRSGQSLYGQSGTVLSGARPLTGWTWDSTSSSWYHAGDTVAPTSLSGSCADGGTACQYPDDVWRGSTKLLRVLSASALAPGRVYVDYTANRVWVKDDPTGVAMEMSRTSQAFVGAGTPSITLSGFAVERFASPSQKAAVQSSTSWVMDHLDVRQNHGVGVEVNSYAVLRNSRVHDQGQLGLSGGGAVHATVTANEVDHNNDLVNGYSWGWEGGGSKFAANTQYLTVTNNYVHDNGGPGLWTDGDNIYTTYDGNRVENNDGPGIFHEISYDAVIKNNTVTGNSRSTIGKSIYYGADILVSDSQNVEVYANAVTSVSNAIGLMDTDRGSGRYGAYAVANVNVHDNAITMSGSTVQTGMVGRSTAFTANNRFVNNAYKVLDLTARYWQWQGALQTKSTWQGYGQDMTGTFATV